MSVCIPVRNEERHIEGCLDSLAGAFSDVVVVDSGSSDQTCRLASSRQARVVQFRWDGGVPKKRNWALRQLDFRHEWILFLDADERLTHDVIEEMRETLRSTRHTGFWLRFSDSFLGHPIRHGDMLCKLALFRIDAGEYETFPEAFWCDLDMEVHEHPVLAGSTGLIRAPLMHCGSHGLHHLIAKHNEYSSWEARRFLWLRRDRNGAPRAPGFRQRFKYRHLDKWWLAEVYWLYSLLWKRGFLDGVSGWRYAAFKRRYFRDIRLKILEHGDS